MAGNSRAEDGVPEPHPEDLEGEVERPGPRRERGRMGDADDSSELPLESAHVRAERGKVERQTAEFCPVDDDRGLHEHWLMAEVGDGSAPVQPASST